MSPETWLNVLPSWIGTLTTLLVLLVGAIVRLYLQGKATSGRVDVLEERDAQQHKALLTAIEELKSDIADQKESRREVWARLDSICDQMARISSDVSYLRGRSNGTL